MNACEAAPYRMDKLPSIEHHNRGLRYGTSTRAETP